jgi:hypothetical protein
MLLAIPDPTQPQEDCDGKSDPRLFDPSARLDHLFIRNTFSNFFQEDLVSRLHAEVDDPQLQSFQRFELLYGLAQDALGISVNAYSTKAGESLYETFQDCHEFGLGNDQGVTVGQEDLAEWPIRSHFFNFFFNDLQVFDAKPAAFVGGTESAPVVRTAKSDLQD